jgi:hypothetical protein
MTIVHAHIIEVTEFPRDPHQGGIHSRSAAFQLCSLLLGEWIVGQLAADGVGYERERWVGLARPQRLSIVLVLASSGLQELRPYADVQGIAKSTVLSELDLCQHFFHAAPYVTLAHGWTHQKA